MVGVRHHQPVQFDVSVVTGGRGQPQADLGSAAAKLLQCGQISHDDIRARNRNKTLRSARSPANSGRQDRRLGDAVDDCGDFDRIQARGDRNLTDDRARIGRAPQPVRELLGNQKPSALDAEQTRDGIVLIEMAFQIEKDGTRFPIADDQVKRLARRDFFNDELVGGRLQRFRKNRRVSPDQLQRARLGTPQDIVQDKDCEKRIGAHFETHAVPFRFLRPQIPLSRSRSRSIATLPLPTIIFSRVPLCVSGFFAENCASEIFQPVPKNKRNENVKQQRIFFTIVPGLQFIAPQNLNLWRNKVECSLIVYRPPWTRRPCAGPGGQIYSDQTANSPPPGASK